MEAAKKERLAEGYVENRDEAPKKAPKKAPKPSKSKGTPPPSWLAQLPSAVRSQRQTIAQIIDAAGLGHRRDDIESMLRCAITLHGQAGAPAKSRSIASRIGGLPDLPAGVAWPRSGKTPLQFVAQVRLDETGVHDVQALLPKAGLLSFFLQASADAGDYLETARVLFFGELDDLRSTEPPKDLVQGAYSPRSVKASADLRLPSPGGPVTDALKLNEDEKTRYWDDVFLKLIPEDPSHRLLGYPDMTTQFAIDKDTALLLQLDTDGDMQFGDAQPVLFHIPHKALLARDFKKAKVTAQEE